MPPPGRGARGEPPQGSRGLDSAGAGPSRRVGGAPQGWRVGGSAASPGRIRHQCWRSISGTYPRSRSQMVSLPIEKFVFLYPCLCLNSSIGDGYVHQVWSNDRYQSVEHRVVVNENKERFSFPLFFNPSAQTDVAPLPEIVGQDLPLYRPYNFGQFMMARNSGNYHHLGKENIQISDFAINRD